MPRADRFLRACRREPVEATPVWLMRQAGRYMPEYRALRARHDFLTLVRTPELAAEITLQPVEAFEVDAAIVFADILPLLETLGLRVRFQPGDGPSIEHPIRTAADVQALAARPVEDLLASTLEAVRLARRALAGRVPLIGFSGAPFTLACYAVQGGGGHGFDRALDFMRREPAAWEDLLTRLAEAVGDYLALQAGAGAQALQLFDSWAGLLTPEDYRVNALPFTAAALRRARAGAGDAPLIHFSTRTTTPEFLPLLRQAGGEVIGIDAGMELARAWSILGHDCAIQGNLDPALLTGPREPMLAAAHAILDAAGGRPGHIFNLGHGVLKETPPGNVAALIDAVHAHRPAAGKGMPS
jgi:uroporphyrinogen decarboxylase